MESETVQIAKAGFGFFGSVEEIDRIFTAVNCKSRGGVYHISRRSSCSLSFSHLEFNSVL